MHGVGRGVFTSRVNIQTINPVSLTARLARLHVSVLFYDIAYIKSVCVYMSVRRCIQCMSLCVCVCVSGSHAGSFRDPACSAGGRGGPGGPGGGDGTGRQA